MVNSEEFLPDQQSVPDGLSPLSLIVEYDSAISYAVQQNRIPVIKRIKVGNLADTPLHALRICITSDPSFSDPYEIIISKISPGETFTIHTIPLILRHGFFRTVVSPVHGSFTAEISYHGKPLLIQSYPVRILAYDQWSGLRSVPELISAFIIPNSPEITAIVQKAQDILYTWTRDSSLTGYQTRDSNRVRKMAAAVYAVLQDLHIRYATPEAGFEQEGQKVRLADTIIGDRMGNCLDLSLLYAGCLERIGLHPLICITEGHAFAGCWLIPDTFSDVVIEASLPIKKRVELGEILLLDVVTATSDTPVSFEMSVISGAGHLSDSQGFFCAIDIKTSRNGRYNIIPLPVWAEDLAVTDETPIPDDQDRRTEPDNLSEGNRSYGFIPTPPGEIHPPLPFFPYEKRRSCYPRLERWMHNLLDLTLRNHLLNMHNSGSHLTLLTPDLTRLKDAVFEGRAFHVHHFDHTGEVIPHSLLPHDPLFGYFVEELGRNRLYCQISEKELSKRLYNLYAQAKKSLEESGAETLYLALGTLIWYETDSSYTPLHAPIMLIPLEITRKDVTTGFSIRMGDDEPRINTTLLERLYQDFQIEIPSIDPLPMDEHGVDVAAVLHQFRKSVKNLPRYEVVSTAVIGHFTFLKYLMWRDLSTHAEAFMENPLVSNLVDPHLFPFPKDGSFRRPETLDSDMQPGDAFCPVGVDSSQLAAVIAAGEGKTFVLHGPPGTGKSQTITNIIAHCLALGKTVLFVSEKRVALDVVHSRLKESGLAPFCLELHSNKSHKREVLRQFEEVLSLDELPAPDDWSLYAEYLADLRAGLNSYVHALHSVRSTGESFYQGLERLIRLRNVEYIPLSWPDASDCSRETLQDIQAFIHDSRIITGQIVHPRDNVWAGVHCTEWSARWKTAVETGLGHFRSSIEKLSSLFPILCDILGIDPASPPSFLNEIIPIYRLLSTAGCALSPDLLRALRDPHTRKEIGGFIQAGKERNRIWNYLAGRYHPDISQLDCTSLSKKIERMRPAWFLRRKALVREIQSDILPYCLMSIPPVEELSHDIPKIHRMQELDNIIRNFSDRAALFFGRYWNVEDQDFDICENLVRSAEAVSAAASRIRADEDGYIRLVTCWSDLTFRFMNESDARQIRQQFSDYEDALHQYDREGSSLADLLQYDPGILWPQQTVTDLLSAQAATVQGWEKETSHLKSWCQWNRIRQVADEKGYSPVIQRYEDATLTHSQIEDLVLRSYYQNWVDGIREQDPVLKEFYRPKFEDSIEKFREIDERFTDLTRKEIEARLSARIPRGEGAEKEELGVLRHQIHLQRRHMPVRSLFKSIPTILPRLKPCLLMSPISVAQYLDPDIHRFDLVIFDEASQIPVSDAIGVIARGNSAIIVGDPKQLPPTSLFQRMNESDGDDFRTSALDLESILDECIASDIPQLHLAWHYRSRHESLIAFSNYHFYRNRLLTFPSPHTSPAISLVHIDGVFDSGNTRTNRAEAEAVVSEIVRRLCDPATSSDSIGVITFNERQQDLIRTLLEKERRMRPDIEPYFSDDRPDSVFIKNLENVQGDERDVILFSVGYGPDKSGRVSLNFGPLNRDGGERRLNVAITRARKEIKVFSSMTPEQIDLSRTRRMGVVLLKSFIEFAEKGPKAIAETCIRDMETDLLPIVSDVAKSLTDQGYEVHTHVGCGGYRIDVAVLDPDLPGRYILGIVCDGPRYQKAKSARDRDVLTFFVLHTLGWNIHRLWSTDWWDEQEVELHRIIHTIEKIRSEYAPETMLYCPVEGEELEEKCEEGDQGEHEILQDDGDEHGISGDEGSPKSAVKSFERSSLPHHIPSVPVKFPEICYVAYVGYEVLGTKDDLLSGTRDEDIIRVLQEIVAIEGPVPRDICIARLLPHWQITRKTASVKNKIESLLLSLPFHRETEGNQIFFWSNHQAFLEYVTFRSHPAGDPWQRKADEISMYEYSNAIIHLMKQTGSMSTSALTRIVGSLFGIKRINHALETRIEQGIALLMDRGEVQCKGDELVYVPPD